MLQRMLLQLRTDHTQTAGEAGRTTADILLPGHIIEMDPGPIGAGHDALSTQDDTALLCVVQSRQSRMDLLFCVLPGRFGAPADEDLVGIMVMATRARTVVMMMLVLFMVMVVIMVMLVFVRIAVMVMVMVMMLVFMIIMVVLVMVLMLMFIMGMVLIVIVVMMVVMIMVVVMLVLFVVRSLLSGKAS